MFGFSRTGDLLLDLPRGDDAIDELLARFAAFTGPDWEQEDDVTVVLVDRSVRHPVATSDPEPVVFRVPSTEGGEREAIRLLRATLADVALAEARRDALSTAVGEAVMNAMEHAHGHDPTTEVEVAVTVRPHLVSVAITDQGGGDALLDTADAPDIDAKLRGDQTPRGWGLFLVRSLVDEVHETSDGERHTLTLELTRDGAT